MSQAIKQMIAQNDSWRDLQTGAKPKRAKLASRPIRPPRRAPLALGAPQG